MKKQLLSLVLSAIASLCMAQAPDFTATDCDANVHHLYAELAQGKVIVICWVMPCGGCVSASVTTANVVQSYQSSHPNTVYMYLCDDYGNSSCATMDNWAISNSVNTPVHFNDANIVMTNYGSAGMPKIVVIGNPTNPTIYYSGINSVNASALQSGIDAALLATGIDEARSTVTSLRVFPNPSSDSAELKFTLAKPSDVAVELFNLEGKKVQNIFSGKLSSGENKVKVNLSKNPAGMYLVKLTESGKSKFINVTVAR